MKKPTGNPNHPVSQFMEGQWQKIAAILVAKYGFGRVVIAPGEIKALLDQPGGVNITIQFSDDKGIELRIVDDVEAERLAREQGGRPA